MTATTISASESSDASIVFFDGVCGLCNHAINFLMARDKHRRLRFAPLQGVTATELVPAEVRNKLDTFVFSDQGRLYYRSTAFARILMRIGGLWYFLGALLWTIPSPLRNLGYRMVSRVRYRLFGKHESCRLPTPEERAMFLD
jgi:predicted DCC family thiol-disulfide oxidoreductase YuxK